MIALGFRRRKETVYLWFGLSVVAWALSSLNFFVRDIFLPLRAWEVIAHASILWWNFCNALFTFRFIQLKQPRMENLFAFHAITGTLLLCFVPLDKIGEVARIWNIGALFVGGYYMGLAFREWNGEFKIGHC